MRKLRQRLAACAKAPTMTATRGEVAPQFRATAIIGIDMLIDYLMADPQRRLFEAHATGNLFGSPASLLAGFDPSAQMFRYDQLPEAEPALPCSAMRQKSSVPRQLGHSPSRFCFGLACGTLSNGGGPIGWLSLVALMNLHPRYFQFSTSCQKSKVAARNGAPNRRRRNYGNLGYVAL